MSPAILGNEMTQSKAHTRGIICGMLAAISYGANPLFAKPMLAAGVGVNSILFYRYFLACILYGLYLVVVKKTPLHLTRKEFAALLFAALLFSFSSISLFASFQYIGAGVSCTLLFVYPSMVALISALFFREKPGLSTGLAIGIATGGVLLLCGDALHSPGDLRGILFVLSSALLYAIYMISIRQIPALRTLRNDKLNFYVLLIGLGVYVCNLRFCTDLQLLPTPSLWGCAIMLALIPTIISLATLTQSIKLIGSTNTAILGALEPLTAIIIGVTIFGEQLTSRIMLGFLLIVSGVLIIISHARNKR